MWFWAELWCYGRARGKWLVVGLMAVCVALR